MEVTLTFGQGVHREEAKGVGILPNSLPSLSSVHCLGSPLVNPNHKLEGLETLWCIQGSLWM